MENYALLKSLGEAIFCKTNDAYRLLAEKYIKSSPKEKRLQSDVLETILER